MEPVEKQGLVEPVITLTYNFSYKIPEIHLQAALFSLEADTEELLAIGFRFETPESRGDHNYYHSQLITGFRGPILNGKIFCKHWLPTSYPALVIDSANVVTFVICVVLSLYGRTYETALLESHFGKELRRYHNELGWRDTGSGRRSRFVEDAGGKWFVEPR